MASKRSRATRTAHDDETEVEGVAPSNAIHPTDSRIYADGRPRMVKGNPHVPGTGPYLAWEQGYRPAGTTGVEIDATESEGEVES